MSTSKSRTRGIDAGSGIVVKISDVIRNQFVYLVLIGLVVVFGLINPRFFSLENFSIIGRQTAIVAVIAFGMTFVLTSGHIDLSVGSIVGLVVMVSTVVLERGGGPILASVAGLVAGTLIGFFNGAVTAKLKVPSFLVTLGTLGIARGIAMTLTGNMVVVVYDTNFTTFWGAGMVGPFPTMVLWTLLFFVISFGIYHHTKFGNYVKSTGDNSTAARYSGINTDATVIKVMMISAFFASIAGLMMVARINAGRPEVGESLNLDAITAVILGGTSLFGGRGSVLRSLIGALIMGVITNALIIFGFEINVQMIVKGFIVIAAVSINEKK